jgi:hypothetical protein
MQGRGPAWADRREVLEAARFAPPRETRTLGGRRGLRAARKTGEYRRPMSLVTAMVRALSTELKCFTAWPPIATKVSLGDYGSLQQGVFNKLGNLADQKVPFFAEAGTDAKLDFTSADTHVTRVVGDVIVNVIPESAVNASIKVRFESDDALLLKAGVIRVESMSNVASVVARLKMLGNWSRSNLVVGAVLHAQAPLLIGARKAGTEVSFGGKTDALKALDLGAVNAGVEVASNKELGLRVVGESGVIGVRLFKVSTFFGHPDFLGPEGAEEEAPAFEWLDPSSVAS